ncbi:hypothetical protein [Pseudomonas veronii]|uniref:hypothetical protein n=1 Tax=Pseudomonas veronii TaxID=76761 RepID=UPI0006262AE1|nr:hypothetical protein [Pseudomonas veronii]
MASKVLKSFLIGIGWDTKALEAGDKKIQSSLQGVKSSALGISAALVGAFGAGAGVILSTASKIDKLAAATQNMRTAMATSYNFGNAVKLMGGEAQEGIDAFKKFEDIQNNLGVKGDPGPVNDLAVAGLNVDSLYKTKNAEEFMTALADMLPKLNEAKKSVVQQTLDISDYAFRLLKDGSEKVYAEMAKAANATGSIDQMTENARKLSESTALLGLKFEGVTNELSEKFLPSLIGASDWLNKFITEHRGDVSKGIDYAVDNQAAVGGLLASSGASILGPILSKIGLGPIGGLATKGGLAGITITGSAIGSNLVNQGLDKYVPGYRGVSQGFDDLLKGATGLDRIPGPLDLMSGRFPSFVDQPKFPTTGDRTAADSMPPQSSIDERYKDVPSQSADDLVRRIQDAKFNVHNNLTIEIDGEKLNHRIIRVNERQNYEAMGDFKPTTER